MPGKNLRFVDSLNPEYFGYLADTLAPDLDSDHKLLAGSAIRAAYGLGLETMFSVLFAALQAPGCIAGWLHKYKPEALRDLARRASAGVPYLNYPLLTGHSFDDIAKMMHSPLNLEDKEKQAALTKGFALSLRRLASDFVDEKRIAEYNDLKHGLRVSSGGFFLSVGTEHEYGVPPPAEEMKGMGGSVWGTRSFSVESLGGKRQKHFWLREQHLNWLPVNHLHGLHIIAWNLQNVLAWLQIYLGREGAKFTYPADPTAYEAPWALSSGVNSFNVDHPVPLEAIRDISDEEILAAYQRPELPPSA